MNENVEVILADIDNRYAAHRSALYDWESGLTKRIDEAQAKQVDAFIILAEKTVKRLSMDRRLDTLLGVVLTGIVVGLVLHFVKQ